MSQERFDYEIMNELQQEEIKCQQVFLVSGKSLKDWVNLKDGLDDFADKRSEEHTSELQSH